MRRGTFCLNAQRRLGKEATLPKLLITGLFRNELKRLQGEEQFRSKKYLLEMPCSHAKRCLKSAPQKLNFVMAKGI